MATALEKALYEVQLDCRATLDRARETPIEGVDVERARLAIELVGCLRRLVPSCSVAQLHRAFGAPGDFGYETALGEALSKLYREAAGG